MIVLASPADPHGFAAIVAMSSPTDPTGFPIASYGPYTFLVAIAWLVWFAAKEFRKGRAEEVEAYKQKAIEAETRANTIEIDLKRQASGLKEDLTNLGHEVETLRDNHIEETARAHAKTERWMRGYFYLRTLLIEKGVNPGPPPEEDPPVPQITAQITATQIDPTPPEPEVT